MRAAVLPLQSAAVTEQSPVWDFRVISVLFNDEQDVTEIMEVNDSTKNTASQVTLL